MSVDNLLTGLKFYYKCDEASGTRADSSVNGLDVGQIGTVNSQSGILGVSVDGTGNQANRLEASHDDGFRGNGASGFTISGWIWIPLSQQGANGPIASHWANTSRGWLLWQRTNKIRFNVSSDGTNTDGEVVWGSNTSEEAWHHCVAWHDPDNDELGLIVDGGTPVTVSHTAGIYENTAPFGLGQFNGSIVIVSLANTDEVAGWDRLLTDAEKASLYGSGTPPSFDTFGANPPGEPTIATVNPILLAARKRKKRSA